ncbi:MAG: glycosyltransferase family 39 protein [Acidimicrobiales bacterium]
MSADAAAFDAIGVTSAGHTLVRRHRLAGVTGAIKGTTAVFLVALGAYLTIAAVLVFVLNVFAADALARVGLASNVLYSRNARLESLGFVWGPIPQVLIVPLLALKPLWPALADHGFASNIVSALFMAGAVAQVYAFLGDLGIRHRVRVTLTVVFAIHPMIVFYGSNGMSEAPYLFFLVTAARHLTRWLRDHQATELMAVGIALALGYLARYEAAPCAAVVAVLVAVLSFRHAGGDLRSRIATVRADLVIFAAPVAMAVVGFALISLVTVGSLSEQLFSEYGATAFRARLAAVGISPSIPLLVQQVLALVPLLPLIALAALASGALRRDVRVLGPLTVLGIGVVVSIGASLVSNPFQLMRYYIVAVPLGVLLAGNLISGRPGMTLEGSDDTSTETEGTIRPGRAHRVLRVAASPLLVVPVLVVPALVASGVAMSTAPHGVQELHIKAAIETKLLGSTDDSVAASMVGRLHTEREVAAFLDRLDLPEGSVLVDTGAGFPVVMASKRPKQFVIPSDLDFKAALADPRGFGIRYILAFQDLGQGLHDAVAERYPDLYERGTGWATLLGDFDNRGDFGDVRIYQVGG